MTRKSIIIKADIPEGVTHYIWWGKNLKWARKNNNKFEYWSSTLSGETIWLDIPRNHNEVFELIECRGEINHE